MADSIDAYLDHLTEIERAAATIETYADILRYLDRKLPWGLDRACHDELIETIHRRPRLSPASRKLHRAAVRGYFTWACDPDAPRLNFDPSSHLPSVKLPRRAPRPCDTEQLADILHRAREPFRLWFLLAAYAGLRCVEISRLDREHVTRDTMWVTGKGSHEREIPTHSDVWAAIGRLPPGPVARTPDGKRRADRHEVSDRANHCLRHTLGHRITMHRLRHWYGSELYQHAGEFVAQQLLGHASPATTAIYALVPDARKRAAVAALPRLMPGPDAAGL